MLLPLVALLQVATQPSELGRAFARTTVVFLRYGDITIATPDRAFKITNDGRNRSVVKSPDGKLIAFVRQDVLPAGEGDDGQTSLRVAAISTGEVRQALGPTRSDDPKQDMHSFDNPHWSLEGGYIYVDAAAWPGSTAVHQVKLATGQERFVIEGSVRGIVRDGPYRGYLLIRRHIFPRVPGGVTTNPVYLIRPDGTIIFQIDGSASDGGEQTVPAWLYNHGWSAS